MKLSDITNNEHDFEVRSSHPNVQEMLDRFHRNEELNCPTLDAGDQALVNAVFMEVVEDPRWRPTPHILRLITDINERMAEWTDRTLH